MKRITFILLLFCVAFLSQCEDALPQSINTIKQQCMFPYLSDYGSVRITAAGDIYLVPCPNHTIFPPFGTVSPLTTKGDIWGYSTTNARIPVGTNGQVLTANSGNALGVSWQTASSISGLTTDFVTKATSSTTIGNSLLVSNTTDLLPSVVGTVGLGTNAFPFRKLFIGNAATNNIQLTGIASGGAKTATFPNFTGTILETAGLTNNFIPRATSTAGAVANTGFSFDGEEYLWYESTSRTSEWFMSYQPQNTGLGNTGFFTVGNNSPAFTTKTSFIAASGSGNIGLANTRVNLQSGDGHDVEINAGNANSTIGGAVKITAHNSGGSNGSSALIVDGAIASPAAIVRMVGNLVPAADRTDYSFASWGIGTNALPFNGLYIGNAPTNNIHLTGTATSPQTITLPDATGTVQLVGAANTGTIFTVPIYTDIPQAGTGTGFLSPCIVYATGFATTEADVSCPITHAGTIRNLYVRTGSIAKANTPTTTITIRKNGVDTSVTLVLTETVNTTTSDTTHNFTVAAGDLITVSVVVTGAAAFSTSFAGITFELD